MHGLGCKLPVIAMLPELFPSDPQLVFDSLLSILGAVSRKITPAQGHVAILASSSRHSLASTNSSKSASPPALSPILPATSTSQSIADRNLMWLLTANRLFIAVQSLVLLLPVPSSVAIEPLLDLFTNINPSMYGLDPSASSTPVLATSITLNAELAFALASLREHEQDATRRIAEFFRTYAELLDMDRSESVFLTVAASILARTATILTARLSDDSGVLVGDKENLKTLFSAAILILSCTAELSATVRRAIDESAMRPAVAELVRVLSNRLSL